MANGVSSLLPAALSILLIGGAVNAFAQQDLDNLADSLIQLRGEVEELQSELDIRRDEHKSRMAYLSAQKAELESNRSREELRIQQLEQDLDELRQRSLAAGTDASSLQPVVLALVDQVRGGIENGIPFKIQERLGELDELRTQLENGVTSPQRGVNRMWAFIEDELRISRENSIYSQTISVNGEQLLADIAKIGTVMMYFKTRDNRYGMAVRNRGGWGFQLLEDSVAREQVAVLFDSLKKQIRQGYFQLPNGLAAIEG